MANPTDGAPTGRPSAGAKVLVAEDNTALAQALAYCLRKAGYSVALAPDGETALALLEQGDPQILVLDLGLPKVDGAAVLRRVRQRSPRLPVLVSSARDDAETRLAEHGLRGDAYIGKPFSIADFERVLLQLAWRCGLADRQVAELALSDVELRLFALFSAGPDEWLEVPDIARRLAAAGAASGDVDRCIEGLRDKLSARSPVRLIKVRGLGYGLVAAD